MKLCIKIIGLLFLYCFCFVDLFVWFLFFLFICCLDCLLVVVIVLFFKLVRLFWDFLLFLEDLFLFVVGFVCLLILRGFFLLFKLNDLILVLLFLVVICWVLLFIFLFIFFVDWLFFDWFWVVVCSKLVVLDDCVFCLFKFFFWEFFCLVVVLLSCEGLVFIFLLDCVVFECKVWLFLLVCFFSLICFCCGFFLEWFWINVLFFLFCLIIDLDLLLFWEFFCCWI